MTVDLETEKSMQSRKACRAEKHVMRDLAMPGEIGMHLKVKLAVCTYYVSSIEL
jgi:hypothetical protein